MSFWTLRAGGVRIRETAACRDLGALCPDCTDARHTLIDAVLVSQTENGAHYLIFTLDEWTTFLAAAKAGEFDPPGKEAIPDTNTPMDICGTEASGFLRQIGFDRPCHLAANHVGECQHRHRYSTRG